MFKNISVKNYQTLFKKNVEINRFKKIQPYHNF